MTIYHAFKSKKDYELLAKIKSKSAAIGLNTLKKRSTVELIQTIILQPILSSKLFCQCKAQYNISTTNEMTKND
jgi:hypothetical protein